MRWFCGAMLLSLVVTLVPGGCPTNGLFPDFDDPFDLNDPSGIDDDFDPFDDNDPADWDDDLDPLDGNDPAGGDDEPNDANQPTTMGAQALFDQAWSAFDRTYSYFRYKGIDWDALQAQHRPDFAQDLSPEAFADALAPMLRELHDWHVSVQKPDNTYVEVYAREIPQTYPSTPRRRYTNDNAYETIGDNVIRHSWFQDNIAYIRVDTLDAAVTGGITAQDINGLFDTYAGADGLILDLRPNNGGDETFAARIAGHFTLEPLTYGHTKTRNGPNHDDFAALQDKVLQPSDGHSYTGPVACLISGRCMSSAEWFTLMMQARPNVTLIGTTTRGSSGNPTEVTLDNGVKLRIPTWVAYTPAMVEIEDRGIAPDIEVAPDASFDGEHDYVIERAIAELTK